MGSVNWEQLSATIAAIGSLVAISTAYLRLYVKNQLLELHRDISGSITLNFMPREMVQQRLSSIESRLDHIEKKLDLNCPKPPPKK